MAASAAVRQMMTMMRTMFPSVALTAHRWSITSPSLFTVYYSVLFSVLFCTLIVFAKCCSEVQASVPGASNKSCECASIHDFSPWASSATEAVKETKFGAKVT